MTRPVWQSLIVIFAVVATIAVSRAIRSNGETNGNPNRIHRYLPAAEYTPIPDCVYLTPGAVNSAVREMPCRMRVVTTGGTVVPTQTPCPTLAPSFGASPAYRQTSDDHGATWATWGCPVYVTPTPTREE